MKQFGKTWWGERWLQALDELDFENRLPRGVSYAKNGRVKEFTIKGNRILARVQGSRPAPYRVEITLNPFSKKEKEVLLKIILERPSLLSKLSNREFPIEIADIAEQNEIDIFPQTWEDLEFECSCPDWATPCKHSAAVVLILANEIDQNPFVYFQLRLFDILKEIQAHNVPVKSLEKEQIPNIQDFIQKQKLKKAKPSQENLEKKLPDYSRLTELRETIFGIYSKKTLFYTGDFIEILGEMYKKNAHLVQKIPFNHLPLHDEYRFARYSILLNGESFEVQVLLEKVQESNQVSTEKISLLELERYLITADQKHINHFSPSYVALYRIYEFALKIIEHSAYIPFLLQIKETYKLIWQPALFNREVSELYKELETWLPQEKILKIQIKGKEYFSNNDLFLLVGIFLNYFVEKSSSFVNTIKVKDEKNNLINDLFFKNKLVSFKSLGTEQFPNTIQLWLNRFYLQKDFHFHFIVEELDLEEFSLEIFIAKKDNFTNFIPLHEYLEQSPKSSVDVFKALDLLEEFFPKIQTIVNSHGKEKIIYSLETLTELLFKIIPSLEQLGIQVLLPKSLKHILKPKPSIEVRKLKIQSYFSLENLGNFDWKIALGEEFINFEELQKLIQEGKEFIRFKESYIHITKSELEKLMKFWQDPPPLTYTEVFHSLLTGNYNGAAILLHEEVKQELEKLKQQDEIPLPNTLRANLRAYQLRGYSWLYKNLKLGFGCILADDMGLGKTLQAIALLAKLKEEGTLSENKALVIVPTTLLTNWQNEIEKFCPSLKTLVYHGQVRKLILKDIDVILTTYGLVRIDNEKFAEHTWGIIIIDEAQNIKNPDVQQTKAVKKLVAQRKIALSGTPVENRLMEYWSIFDFVNQGYLGLLKDFQEKFAKPIEIEHNRSVLEKFQVITSPFIMRRLKTDKSIIQDLPDKIENNYYCNLTKQQTALYESTVDLLLREVEALEGIERQGIVFKLLVTLKQICNHPSQYTKETNYDPKLSGKAELMLQLLENIYENDEKVLIFTQYKEMSMILKNMIKQEFQKESLEIHGELSRKERDNVINLFQNSTQFDTLILTLKAGGVGLNLTAANHVIHYDLWWNPAVENQATDRAYRIGQTKNVMVYRLITKHTLEEKIQEMIQRKKDLASLTVTEGEKWIGNLSNEELSNLVRLA